MKTLHFPVTDSHCHLDFAEFNQELPSILNQCLKQNIHQIVVPAIAPHNWQSVLDLAKNHSSTDVKIKPCLGIHPWFLSTLTEQHLQQLEQQIINNIDTIVALGETGLDGVIARDENNLAQQLKFFDFQLSLAKKHTLPVIIHHRRSHPDILAQLKQHQLANAGIIHAFSGSYQQACQYIDLGFKLGIGGTITYPRAEKTIKALQRLPLSSLVIETDAPAMPLYGHQGTNNSPLMISDVFHCLAKIRAESAQTLASALEQNIHDILPAL